MNEKSRPRTKWLNFSLPLQWRREINSVFNIKCPFFATWPFLLNCCGSRGDGDTYWLREGEVVEEAGEKQLIPPLMLMMLLSTSSSLSSSKEHLFSFHLIIIHDKATQEMGPAKTASTRFPRMGQQNRWRKLNHFLQIHTHSSLCWMRKEDKEPHVR